jgi:2-methylisocitrate lyase-like PEP mutase family enzyme
MKKSRTLKNLLSSGETLIMPDAYDPISALLIQKAGFKAVQCSGYSFSIVAGYKAEIDVSLDENLEWTGEIVNAVEVPVMADAEDGYGDPDTVKKTVERFIDAGVAGLNLEDQIPNKEAEVSIISSDMMADKINSAREVAENLDNPDFIINGRTDALKAREDREEALDLAMERANEYLAAGADLAFITYVETLDEVETITREVNGPVSIAAGMPYNIREFSIADLRRLGVTRVSLPTLLIFSSLQAIHQSLQLIKADKISSALEADLLYSTDELRKLLDI